MGVAELARARDRILGADATELTTTELCEELALAVESVAPYDACALLTTDPETHLPSGGVVKGFDPSVCGPFWDNELLDPDFCKFTDLARSLDPVATLYEAVDGDLARSPRYNKLYAAFGTVDELRAAFVAGSSCLAIGTFVRTGGEPFTPTEVRDVRDLVPVACTMLRRALGRFVKETSTRAPVVIMLDGEGEVTGVSEGGRALLEDLRINEVDGELPGVIKAAAIKARWSRSSTNFTTRMCGRSGEWLRLHVTPMEGEVGAVAVTVETARPDDLARILLESYGLTERETDIALHLCRGYSSKEIAAELIISVHTVRDHVKSIYDKAGVSSRGELVATLFATHVLSRFETGVAHLG